MVESLASYGPTQTEWHTDCEDWRERIISGKSLMPVGALNPSFADLSMKVFDDLILVDAGRITLREACQPWARDFARAIFGAYDPHTGRRLIRYFFLQVAKKNSKSSLAAGIMLTALLRNFREAGEFYILAPTVEVANNSFGPARDMVRASEKLSKVIHIQEQHRTLKDRRTGAFLKIVAADNETVSGKKAIGVLVDELWLFGKRNGAENMLREATGGLASRPEGFVVYLTTQSDVPPAGIFKQLLDRFRDIRDAKLVDRRSLGQIFEFPPDMLEDGSFRDESNWHIPNPNLNVSVDLEYLREQSVMAEAAGELSYRGFAAKHLNVQIGMALRHDGWAGAEQWVNGTDPILAAGDSQESLNSVLTRSEVVTVGIDGGGLDDLLGIAVIGREKGTKKWLHWAHAYVSPQGIERRKANESLYRDYITAGDLSEVELPDDLDAVVQVVLRIHRLGILHAVGVDRMGIGGLIDKLNEIGITEENGTLRGVAQGIALMGAIKTVERKLVDGSFKHRGSPLMAWCVGNATVHHTATAMRIVRDPGGYKKIDPLAATFDAAELMALNPHPKGAFQMMVFGEEMPPDPVLL